MKKYRNILVTGSAGFIGFHLARKILTEHPDAIVIGVDSITDYYDVRMKEKRNDILKQFKNYHFYKTDITHYKKLEKIVREEKPDVIIHLAAQAGVRYSLENPWAYAESNYVGTLNVFEVARNCGITKVLFASSSSVYGANVKMPFSEKDPTDHPLSIYAASKKANELLAYSCHHLFGMDTIGMRFFTVYGDFPRPDLALFKFVKKISQGKTIDVFNQGNMKRTFTYIDDILSGILKILEKGKGFEIYNLGGGQAVPLMRFVELIEKNLQKRAVIKLLPLQPGDVKVAIADISKAKKDLGFKPKTSIEDGIAKFTKWFVNNREWLLKLKDSK